MNFKDRVQNAVKKDLNLHEGACGICHLTLKEISSNKGTVVCREVPEGIVAEIKDEQSRIIGQGKDLVWAPAILKAQINAELIPYPITPELKGLLTSKDDLNRVAQMYGYGRCVSAAGIGINIIWSEGGRVQIERDGLAIKALLYDENDNLLVEGVSGFCPVCAVNISISRDKRLRKLVNESLKDQINTGKIKHERGIKNLIEWKKRRIITYLKEDEKVIGVNWGCCIAYATIRAEISAGFGSRKWNRIFKNYCDFCPLKHCWTGKSMGALGNIILERWSEIGITELVRYDKYITALIYDQEKEITQGRGTLCSLSATVNAFMRSDAVKTLKPSPAKGFPYNNQ